MAPDSGRHDADENATDRARIDYLAGEANVELDAAEQAELDELRALLADPTLWSEPPAELEDSVVALIAAEARATTETPAATDFFGEPGDSADAEPPPFPTSARTGDPVAGPDSVSAPPIDLGAARANEGTADRCSPVHPAGVPGRRGGRDRGCDGFRQWLILRSTTAPRQFDVALAATELAPGAAGSATMLKTDSGWEIQLDATGLPRRENGDFYQAWLRNADGVLVPIGTFNEGEGVILWAGVSPEKFPTMTITLESADGNQDSSGQRVLVGTAVEK